MMINKSIFRITLALLLLLSFVFSNAQVKDTSLVIGNFEIIKVTDGDTFKFKNLDKSTRLLCIDTEETFKSKDAKERAEEIASDWLNYYSENQKGSSHPIKIDSPFGYDTWQWTKEFMEDVDSVRLEKDDNLRGIDVFDRYLVYVIAYKKGREVNYNLECVKKGYSPYFNKYGNSRRFHKDFIDAQEYAKLNKLGIWNSKTKCYPDYEERIIWWNKRAEQILNFENKYANDNRYVNFLSDDGFAKLKDYINADVIIFASIGEIFNSKYPYLIRFSHDKNNSVDLVVFEDKSDEFNEIKIEDYRHYYIYVKGKLELYKGRYKITFKNKNQLWME